jgi:hypothetical protein
VSVEVRTLAVPTTGDTTASSGGRWLAALLEPEATTT